MTKPNSLLSDVTHILGSNATSLVGTFLAGVVTARFLGAEGLGIFTAVLVVPRLLQSLAELGARQAMIYLVGREAYPIERIVGALSATFLLSSAVGMTLCLVAYRWFEITSFRPWHIALAVAWLPLATVRSYAQGILAGRQMMGSFARLTWIPTILQLILITSAACLSMLTITTAILSLVLSSAFSAVHAALLVRRLAPLTPKFHWDIIRKMCALGMIYALALFVINLNYRISIVLMQKFSTLAEIGKFSLGLGYAELIWQIPAAVGVIVFSRTAASKDNRSSSELAMRLTRVSLLLCAVGALCLAALGPWFIPLVYGKGFGSSVLILQILLPGTVLLVFFKVLNTELAGRGKPWVSMLAALPGLAVNVLAGLALIPKHGSYGAAIATSLGYSVMAVGFIYVYLRFTKISLGEILKYRAADFEGVGFLGDRLLRRQNQPVALQKG